MEPQDAHGGTQAYPQQLYPQPPTQAYPQPDLQQYPAAYQGIYGTAQPMPYGMQGDAGPGQSVPHYAAVYGAPPIQPFPNYVPPPPRKRARGWIAAAVGILLIAAAGVFVVASRNASPDGSATPAGASSGQAQPLTGDPAQCDPTQPVSCLEPAPSGTDSFDDAWSGLQAPTVAQYVQHWFSAGQAQDNATANLDRDGVRTLAHIDWKNGAGDEFDVVLLGFATAQGALAWSLDRTANAAMISGSRPLAVGGAAGIPAYATTKPDAQDFINVRYAVALGDVAAVIWYASPSTLSSADFQTWTAAQYSLLAHSPLVEAQEKATAAPSTAGLAPFKAGAGCLNGRTTAPSDSLLDSCLMHLPSGTTADTANSWDSTQNATIAKYVAEYYGSDGSTADAYEEQYLANAGVKTIVHRRWEEPGGANTDDILFGMAGTDQAAALFLAEASLEMGDSTPCSSAQLPGAYCEILPVDSSGNIPVRVYMQIGPVYMKLTYYSATKPDTAQILLWAQKQAELLGT